MGLLAFRLLSLRFLISWTNFLTTHIGFLERKLVKSRYKIQLIIIAKVF